MSGKLRTASTLWSGAPEFGTVVAGAEYADRPGAYAIVRDAEARIALVVLPIGRYLPGGGCDPGESLEQTLARELAEECGFRCKDLRFLGEAVQFVRSASEARYYRKHGHYFAAELDAVLGTATEPDHAVEWVAPGAAADRVAPPAQAWVLARYLESGRMPHG